MLNDDLAELIGSEDDVPPPGLEQAIWCRVDVLLQSRRLERTALRLQALGLIVVLGASTTIGMTLAPVRSSPTFMPQITSDAAGLAPSALLGFAF